MAADFPELNSFGTLLKFAIALEEAAAELAALAAEQDGCERWRDVLGVCARKHARRGQRLERLRRERLNEVVLQAITGMERERYLPVRELPENGAAEPVLLTIAALEETVASFYTDGSEIAANVLAGVEKTFRKFARESVEFAAVLRAETP